MLYPPAPRVAPVGPELSLLTAARLNPAGLDRWEEAYLVPGEHCGHIGGYSACSTNPPLEFLDRGRAKDQQVDPVTLVSESSCSITGNAAAIDDARQEATDLLTAMTAFGLERELWTGALARRDGLQNRALTANDAAVAGGQTRATTLTTGTTGVSPLALVGLMEEALGQYPTGLGYLHVNLRGAAFLAGQTSREGNRLRTKLGSVLVPGAGYTGTGPDGAAAPDGTTWVYGTGPVTVRLSPVVVPDQNVLVDRAANTITVRAERQAAATWSGCALFAALLTLKSD